MRELRQYVAQSVAEFFGTFMLILIGESAIAQYKFSQDTRSTPLAINISFGVGVYTALMIAGPISGAHLNPAVSISFLSIGKLKPIQLIFYTIGQIFGAFFGALLVFLLHQNLFDRYDGGVRQMFGAKGTADIFFTSPADGVVYWNSFFDQVIGTAVLMIFIMALCNGSNRLVSEEGKPFAFVLIIVAITSAFAVNAGAAINPARDFGPRLFAGFVYDWKEVFSANGYFFWVPIVGPIVGGLIGTWIYELYFRFVKPYANISSKPTEYSIALRSDAEAPNGEDRELVSCKLTSIQS